MSTYHETELQRLQTIGDAHGLTRVEVAAAEAAGLDPAAYATWKNVQNLADAEAAIRAGEEHEEAVQEARRLLAIEAAKKEIAARGGAA